MIQKKKSVKIWIIMLVLPIALLILVTLGQIIANFALTNITDSSSSDSCNSNQINNGLCEAEEASGPSVAKSLVNVASLLIGIFSVIGILAYPVWITLLVVAIQHNKKIDEAQNQQNTPQNQPPQTPTV